MDAPITTRLIPSQRNGSETSSLPDTSRQETLTSEASSMSGQTMCEAIPNVTSSPGLADGAMPFGSQDGLTTDLFGQEVVHASRSASRGNGKALPTIDTSGLSGDLLFKTISLELSLENRLRARLTGSGLCEVTWAPWATLSQRVLLRPRARVRTISETDMGLWPTARANKWGPPNSHGNTAMFQVSPWATPAARDYRSDRSQKSSEEMYGSKGRPLPRQALEATWPTPKSSQTHGNGYEKSRNGSITPTLNGVTGAASFPGSLAPMEKPGGLNPEFVCWLMGYPTEWVSCGASVTLSTRARSRNSSSRQTKQSEPQHDNG